MTDNTTAIQLFRDIDCHLLQDDTPSVFLDQISVTAVFEQYPFDMLLKLNKTPQSPKHHPEGNVWNHAMLVLDEAAKRKEQSSDARSFMWAALLHDIGKPAVTKIRRGKITAYDHDRIGADLAKGFLDFFEVDEGFIKGVTSLIRWHMQILYVVNNLPFKDISRMKNEVNINDIALLGLCDRLGRGNADKAEEENAIQIFLTTVNKH